MKFMDAHIHLDYYSDEEIANIIKDSPLLEAMISVSANLESSKRNLELTKKYSLVKPAFGYHPEQPLPSDKDLERLVAWMRMYRDDMVAVGEVGLPYYMRQEGKLSKTGFQQSVNQLETFIKMTKEWDKPIVLHAVYDDAPVVCDLLEKYSIKKAHFHWFKGDPKTIERMIANGYYVSITPDVVYKEKTQKLVDRYPLELMMVETDGPWPFEGPFQGKMTHPNMILESIQIIADRKKQSIADVSTILLNNTKNCYQIETLREGINDGNVE